MFNEATDMAAPMLLSKTSGPTVPSSAPQGACLSCSTSDGRQHVDAGELDVGRDLRGELDVQNEIRAAGEPLEHAAQGPGQRDPSGSVGPRDTLAH